MIHDFPELKIGERGACRRCGHIVIRTEFADLTKVSPSCGEPSPFVPAPDFGPGTEFAALAAALGFSTCGGCDETGKKMNREGAEWCEAHRAELVAEIKSNFDKIASGAAKQLEQIASGTCTAKGQPIEEKRGYWTTLLAKAKMLTGASVAAAGNLLAGEFVPSPRDPVGSLIDEAIARARAKAAQRE